MFKRILFYALLLLCSGIAAPAFAQQQDPKCSFINEPITKGEVFFNYGSATDAFSIRNRSSYSIGEPVVGSGVSQSNISQMGFWSRFLITPLAPLVTATQGELLDRIQLSWAVNPLGAPPSEGFKLYRDGVFLALVDNNTRNFNDFNVIAGRAYHYEVRCINQYGEGFPGTAIGFQVPNGVVTGWVQTLNNRPVPDAFVTLTPLQGFSSKFSATAGAFAEADASTGNSFLPVSGAWSIAFWIKTDVATANAGIFQLSPYPLYITALNSGGGTEGIAVSTAVPGASILSGTFPAATKNGWHHVAIASDGNTQGRLYIDGVLVSLATMNTLPSADLLNVGVRTNTPGTWAGRLDELRIYNRRLDELDLGEIMMGTASSQTPDLTYYWKMDEELGTGSFDVLRRNKLFFCGADFDADRPQVRTMGKTNSEGYYRIESASYGTGTTFLAQPMKNFYMYRALKFVRNESDYATLPDFSVTPKATLELWVNSAGPDGTQCALSKKWSSNDFRLLLKQSGATNNVWFYLNGQEHNFGTLGMGYQHLAFTISTSGTSRTVTAYKNGVLFGVAHTFTGITGDWSDPAQPWVMGARPSGGGNTDFYDGLVDEVALYDTTLSIPTILGHFNTPRNMQERGLRVYFSLDEGNGSRLNNSGSVLLSFGTNFGADWSPFAAKQLTTPHIFTPVTRQVTLNPSVTSVDQVDFTDLSTVAVSGFVRYKNTDCFAPNVEILVNGASFSPKIFTDSTGKFIIDFDPGATATLTPKFEDHLFVPAFWDVTNVTNPIAGVLFNDITTHKVKGQVVGGLCKKSIIKAPPGVGQGTVCIVKVRSADGCLERQITIDNQEGDYEFLELPPLESLTVAVVEHSDPLVKTAFQVLGGSTVNLTKRDTIIDFIYFAVPEVAINSGLVPIPGCIPPTYVLDQGEIVTLSISLNEQYVPILNGMGMVVDDGICPLDTANFRIINGFIDATLDTTMSNGILKYKFKVGDPNPSPPFLKTLQILGTSLAGREGSLTRQAIVTGIRNKENTFTTLLPETPSLILRDPPGDGSSAFLEKNTKMCKTYQTSFAYEVGGGGGLELHLGGALQVVTAPLGIGTIGEAGPVFDIAAEAQVTYKKITDSTFQTCTTINQKISTSDQELIVGGERGADLYMGDAINIIFGFADQVTFDPMTCSASTNTVLNVEPGNFSTVFIYSEFHIVNNVMRYLGALAADPTATPADVAQYTESRNRWQAILDKNKALKEKAKLVRNISFDAGITYEYAESSDTTTASSTEEQLNSEESLVTHIGFEFNKAGFIGTLKFVSSTSDGEKNENGTEKGITTGYTLADNDPGDAFTVDVAMDSIYKTPVFRLKAGQSSCPWEPITANREGPNLQLAPGSQFKAINVPANEPAVFQMKLGNLSASNEDWTYGFTSIAANNPNGAVIKLNGQPLTYTQKFIVPYGTSKMVTLTVERGPLAYEYDSLLVALYSECEYERNFALSLPLDGDPKFFSPIYLGVDFIRPCSEVNINVPEQDWVIFPDPLTPGPDDIRRITVSGYDTTAVDFQLIRVQYRRSDGDGAWINIPGISDRYNPNWVGYAALPLPRPPVLLPGFTQFFWETTGLSDGPYEIRAVAICTGDASEKPGYSAVIKGRIDREPPSLVGNPQPSDGVYNVGDEISFTFNKHINCDKLIPGDQTQPNNVALYDATTDDLIDIDITCFENKIVIDPNFQNEFFENRILRAELHNIEDLTGNKRPFLKWEFYVDRNELAWLTDSLGMTKFEDQTKTVTASIHNRGGSPVPFTITGAPSWLRIVPNSGTLVANEIRPISFEADSTLGFGNWRDTIILHTETGQNPFFMGGDEALPVGVRVVCRPPNWNISAGLFENTMNMVLRLNIQGVFSNDEEDIVAAYIGDELRGRARVQYVPELNTYLAYLTVYGDPSDQLDPVRLEIWDASACLRYGQVIETFAFQPDLVIGIPDNPQVVHTNSLVLREVPFGYGWNWLSFNLAFPDNSLNAALASLKHPENDLMKSQSAFSTYSGGWFGSLTNLGNTTMYIYRADIPDTLKMMGNIIDPATTNIPLVTGWNWIGYVPNYALPINEALSSLPSQAGDLIKGQLSFAQYINPTFGWIGNLKYLQPPNGYQIKIATPGTLTYPPSSQFRPAEAVESRDNNNPFWTVNPTQYEYSMTLIGMLKNNEANTTSASMELGAFAGNEIRGSSPAIFIAPMNAYMFFLTMYANASGELLQFKLFDSTTGTVQVLNEQLYFSPNQHQGSIEVPVPFTLQSSGSVEAAVSQSFDVQPNPFQTETMFRFALPNAQDVQITVTNVSGQSVASLRTAAHEGLNTVIWKGQADTGAQLDAGIYFVRLQTEFGSVVRKVVLQ